MFTAALFTIAKTGRQPKRPSTEEWIKKIWCVCVCVCVCKTKYYSVIKKNEIFSSCSYLEDLEDIMLSEISHR